tara:strand:- start:228 stop:1139 length:912 start_codon:yes stop_codon:yes gene_type:complete
MTYSSIEKRLAEGKIIILDGGIGGELQKVGAKMDEGLWCGRCSIDSPNELLKVHQNYIQAGADVITANTYASTPISMKKYGYENIIKECNHKSIEIAKKAVAGRDVLVAGSVSTYGYFMKDGIKKMKPSFDQHLNILSDVGVDLIILEAMSSQADIVEVLVECSNSLKLPIWLSISCVFDKNKNIHLGYDDDVTNNEPQVYERLEESLLRFKKFHSGPILVAHSNMSVTEEAIKILKSNYNHTIGAYPNRGYFVKPEWKFTDDVTTSEYFESAKKWINSGAQIIGGCCGIGVEEIKAISILKN